MADKTEGQRAFESDVAMAFRLLEEGYSPEEVEEALAVRWREEHQRTALSDPTNVMMQEVTHDGSAARTR